MTRPAHDDDHEPTGLVLLGRARLVRVFALCAVLAIILLAIPALLAQPRDEAPHLSQQDTTTGRTR